MTDKLVRNGRVAVLYSPGFGAGWSTWMNRDTHEQGAFDPDLAKIILGESDGDETLEEVAARKYPHDYLGGLSELQVQWLPEGTAFSINEYDGSESIQTATALDYIA